METVVQVIHNNYRKHQKEWITLAVLPQKSAINHHLAGTAYDLSAGLGITFGI